MPLKYNAPTPAATQAVAPVPPAPAEPKAGGVDSTRAQLFNPDGSPKPIRNLSALRDKLAGNGGVNPPESQVPETALEPRTEETADGGVRPIGALPETPTTKRTRRTPAQMAEAKAATEAAKAALDSKQATGPAVGSGAVPVAAGSAASSVRDYTTDELLSELYRRLRGAP
jgi:hypothetical protein